MINEFYFRMQAAGNGINQYNGVFDAYYKIAKVLFIISSNIVNGKQPMI